MAVAPEAPQNLHLITALRYDRALLHCDYNTSLNRGEPSAYLLLSYHYERLLTAAHEHGPVWASAAECLTLDKVREACQRVVDQQGEDGSPLKIRLALALDGTLDASATRVPPLANPSDPFHLAAISPLANDFAPYQPDPLTLYLAPSTEPTLPSLYTRTKTTHRAPYDTARTHAGVTLGAPTDVLLFDEQDQLMEASIRNVALWRDGCWVTPGANIGCLPGVARRWLLEHDRIREDGEGILRRENIHDEEIVLTFNGVEGCRYGRARVRS